MSSVALVVTVAAFAFISSFTMASKNENIHPISGEDRERRSMAPAPSVFPGPGRTTPFSQPSTAQSTPAPGPAPADPRNLFFVSVQHRYRGDRHLQLLPLFFGTGILSIAPTAAGQVLFPTLAASLYDQASDSARDVSLSFPNVPSDSGTMKTKI